MAVWWICHGNSPTHGALKPSYSAISLVCLKWRFVTLLSHELHTEKCWSARPGPVLSGWGKTNSRVTSHHFNLSKVRWQGRAAIQTGKAHVTSLAFADTGLFRKPTFRNDCFHAPRITAGDPTSDIQLLLSEGSITTNSRQPISIRQDSTTDVFYTSGKIDSPRDIKSTSFACLLEIIKCWPKRSVENV